MLKQKTTGSFMSLDANTLVGVHNNNSEHLRSTYCMPDIVLSSFHVLTHFIPQQPYEVCSIIIPSLQMSHPEVKELAQRLSDEFKTRLYVLHYRTILLLTRCISEYE